MLWKTKTKREKTVLTMKYYESHKMWDFCIPSLTSLPFFYIKIFDRIESSRVTNLLPTTFFQHTEKYRKTLPFLVQNHDDKVLWYEIFPVDLFSCFYVVDIINSHMWLESLVFIVVNWVISFFTSSSCFFFYTFISHSPIDVFTPDF
jgi:hypothetical protein